MIIKVLFFLVITFQNECFSDTSLILKNVNLIDLNQNKVIQTDIQIKGGKIFSIMPNILSQESEVIDYKYKKWVLPPLYDLHVHSWGNQSPTESGDEDLGTQVVAKKILHAGIFGFLDLGANEKQIFEDRIKLQKSDSISAKLFCAGSLFVFGKSKPEKYPSDHARLVSSEAEAKKSVSELALKKPDVIKIILDHTQDFESFDFKTLTALITEAHKYKIKTIVHIGSWEDARMAIRAGTDVITHFDDDEVIPDSIVKEWKKQKVISMPTLAVQYDMAAISDDFSILDDPLLLQVTTVGLRNEYKKKNKYTQRTKDWIQWQKDDLENDRKTFLKLKNAGIQFLAGSDSANIGTFHGFSLHRELEWLVKFGLKENEALKIAAVSAAKFLNQDDKLSQGSDANLILLDANPLKNIRNSTRISEVFLRGIKVNKNDLLN